MFVFFHLFSEAFIGQCTLDGSKQLDVVIYILINGQVKNTGKNSLASTRMPTTSLTTIQTPHLTPPDPMTEPDRLPITSPTAHPRSEPTKPKKAPTRPTTTDPHLSSTHLVQRTLSTTTHRTTTITRKKESTATIVC